MKTSNTLTLDTTVSSDPESLDGPSRVLFASRGNLDGSADRHYVIDVALVDAIRSCNLADVPSVSDSTLFLGSYTTVPALREADARCAILAQAALGSSAARQSLSILTTMWSKSRDGQGQSFLGQLAAFACQVWRVLAGLPAGGL